MDEYNNFMCLWPLFCSDVVVLECGWAAGEDQEERCGQWVRLRQGLRLLKPQQPYSYIFHATDGRSSC